MLEPGESVSKFQKQIAEEIGETALGLADLQPGLAIALELYQQTAEAQAAIVETQMSLILTDMIAMEQEGGHEQTLKRMADVYLMLEKRIEKYSKAQKDNTKTDKDVLKTTEMLIQSNMRLGAQYLILGRAAQASAVMVIAAKAQEAIANLIADAFSRWGFFGAILASSASAVVGSAMQQAVNFAKGETGMDEVVTKPTLILAGEGNKAESVQITPLEGPNISGPQGGSSVTVNVSGNVLTQDFVEQDLAEAIRDAARRGTDFGLS